MRIKLSQLRRIIKEEADRFIAESYSGEVPNLPDDYAAEKAANRGQAAREASSVSSAAPYCPMCDGQLSAGEDGIFSCSECGWSEDDVLPLEHDSGY